MGGGANIRVDYRFAGSDPNLIREYPAELIRLTPDVIVASSIPVVSALRQATNTIPIVFVVNDPVGQGVISSAAHPGGNVTGFSFIEPEMLGKWLTMLKDVAPKISRANLMFNPTMVPYYDDYLRSPEVVPQSTKAQLQARPLASAQIAGADVTALAVRQTDEIESAIAKLARDPSNGLIAPADPFIIDNIRLIAQLTVQQRIPAIAAYRQFVAEGGLMSYGPDTADIFRRAAGYVDRILKGAKPADLPLQSPDRFELAINLKTAKVLGLQPSPTLVAIADEVIE